VEGKQSIKQIAEAIAHDHTAGKPREELQLKQRIFALQLNY